MQRKADDQSAIHQHSGWLIPLGFAAAILALSGMFLLWYLRPAPGPRSVAPTEDEALVQLSVRGLRLAIPANYIETAAARGGGPRDVLALFALIPSMHGYSDRDARLFAGNPPDSPVIHLVLRDDPNSLDVAARLARVYLPDLANPHGDAGPFGLVQYGFKPESVYSRRDLFVGGSEAGPLLFLCERAQTDLPGPNCLAAAPPPAGNLSFSWRFKRAHLSEWRQIAGGVNRLMARFKRS